jgi:hypothetical protein
MCSIINSNNMDRRFCGQIIHKIIQLYGSKNSTASSANLLSEHFYLDWVYSSEWLSLEFLLPALNSTYMPCIMEGGEGSPSLPKFSKVRRHLTNRPKKVLCTAFGFRAPSQTDISRAQFRTNAIRKADSFYSKRLFVSSYKTNARMMNELVFIYFKAG